MSIRLITKAWETDLKGNELLVLLSLSDNASDEGVCFPSWETIIKKTKVSRGTLSKTLKKLEEKGHLKRENRKRSNGSNTSNLYMITPIIYSSEVELSENHSSEVELGHSSEVELHASSEVELLEPSLNRHSSLTVTLIEDEKLNQDAFNQWLEYKGKKYTKQGKTLSKNFLVGYDKQTQQEIVNKSIMNNYAGLFPPTVSKQKQTYAPVNGMTASQIRDALAEEAERGLQNAINQ